MLLLGNYTKEVQIGLGVNIIGGVIKEGLLRTACLPAKKIGVQCWNEFVASGSLPMNSDQGIVTPIAAQTD